MTVEVVTGHSAYDWDEVMAESAVVVDTRNVLRGRRRAARVVGS